MFGDQPFATLPYAAIAEPDRVTSAFLEIGAEVFMLAVRDVVVWQPRIRHTRAMDATARDTTETRE